jgi:hypothetical protein
MTDWYDCLMGRVCPICVAKQCAAMGKSMVLRDEGKLFMGDLLESEIEFYLVDSNKHLLAEPLIEESKKGSSEHLIKINP